LFPGNQMYLPMLAIDLREHFRRIREETPTFSPSTQVVVLHALLRDAGQVLIPTEMAQLLGYSAMTMTRAFDELETASLAEVTIRGRGALSAFQRRPKRNLGERSALPSQPGEQTTVLSAAPKARKALSVRGSQHWRTTACWQRRRTQPMR
jgi:hypothetical protein